MKPRNFRIQMTLAALLPSMLLATVLAALWFDWSQDALDTALKKRVEAVGGHLAAAAEFHMFTGDILELQALVTAVTQGDEDIVAVSILDLRGNVLVRSGAKGISPTLSGVTDDWVPVGAGQNRLIKPIRQVSMVLDEPFTKVQADQSADSSGSVLGYVVLEVSMAKLQRERDKLLQWGLVSIVLALLAAGAIVLYFAERVTSPISRMMDVVERIGRGDLRARLIPDAQSVLFPLEQGINQMAEKVAVNQKELQARVDAATSQLLEQKHLAERDARIDSLTGLHNRRAFIERGEMELNRVGRYGTPLALIMMDLDYFKVINDTYGHDAGDRVLTVVADDLLRCMRELDFVARLGGEEFVILMPDTDIRKAEHAAERMRLSIAALRIETESSVLSCTASFGVTECSSEQSDLQTMLVQADRTMYEAKTAGRNCVRVYPGKTSSTENQSPVSR